MNIFSELKIGDKMSLDITQKYINQDVSSMLTTQLIDMDDYYLYISPPAYKGKKFSLMEGHLVNLFFYRKTGVYSFEAKVVKKINEELVTFVLEPTSSIERIQRRNYYRLPIVLPCVLKKQENDKVVEYSCVSKDLSGGGIKLICKQEINLDENIVVTIKIHEEQMIAIKGKVIRVVKGFEDNSYEISVEFKNVEGNHLDQIIAFIFEKQRLMRKKGLM